MTIPGRCDDYFFLPARGEHRGVGGIFFDDLVALPSGATALPLVRDVGEGFMPSYLPIARRRQAAPFTAEQRDWQLLRRGRYLEFNLLYDRGVVRPPGGPAGGDIPAEIYRRRWERGVLSCRSVERSDLRSGAPPRRPRALRGRRTQGRPGRAGPGAVAQRPAAARCAGRGRPGGVLWGTGCEQCGCGCGWAVLWGRGAGTRSGMGDCLQS